MRLLNTKTGQFHEIADPSQTRYATLSHVWAKHGEMSYQDVERIRFEQSKTVAGDTPDHSPSLLPHLSAKIRNACALALSEGLLYIWIDTCCIDKTSSAELSEAINSMYVWYAQSTVCYAYLEDADVSKRVDFAQPSIFDCKWFTRAWTLQELIAPRFLVLVGPDWEPFGTKDSYAEVIASITRVPRDVLLHVVPADGYSVATRMSWASNRASTRVEDQAYSLMGFFGVHMPTIYGEGTNAFRRLQEEILKQDPDQSVLVWGSSIILPSWSSFIEHARTVPDTASNSHDAAFDPRDPFATSPESFGQSTTFLRGTLRTIDPQQLAQHIAKPGFQEAVWPNIVVTPVGVDTRAPIVLLPSVHPDRPLYAAFLACEYRHWTDPSQLLLPVLLLSPMDPKRASLAGASRAGMRGGIHFYILNSVCFVPPASTVSRPGSGYALSRFEDICLGYPRASHLKRFHPLPEGQIALQDNDRRGIIAPGFRLSLAPMASYYAWAYYELSQSMMLDGGSWLDGVIVRKYPPTHSLVFTSKNDPDDRLVIRLGPCNDAVPCDSQSSVRSSTHSAPSSIAPGLRDVSSLAPSSRLLRAILSRTSKLGHNDDCIPSAELDTVSTRTTSSESHTEHVASWTQKDGCFIGDFICPCTVGRDLRVVLTILSWWPSMHPSAYPDTYRLGVTISPTSAAKVKRPVDGHADLAR